MKISIIILFLIVSVAVNATTYYIDPSGSDSNNGSSSSPWKTVAYACSKATSSGDIIHVNTGTFIETNEMVLAAGVSLIGSGINNTIIKSHYQYTRGGNENVSAASLCLRSTNPGANGNQTISDLTLDGDWAAGKGVTGSIGILVRCRSNVILRNCIIKDFFANGVTFAGNNDYSNSGSDYATGNQAYNLTVTNCGDQPMSPEGGGGFVFGHQDGMLVHDNTFDNTNVYRFASAPYGHASDNVGTKFSKNCKFYNNKSYKPDYAGVTEGGSQVWNFHMECWNQEGGFEVYNNEFYDGDCAIDVGGSYNHKGSSAYSWYIHNNLFTGAPVKAGQGKESICIEGPDVNDVWMYYNHFLNLPCPLGITNGWGSPSVANNISFNYNIVENAGWLNTGTYGEIVTVRCAGGDAVQNLYMNNNIIQSNTGDHNTGIHIYGGGTVSNVNIKNNIIVNNENNGFLRIDNSGSWNGFYVNNNIFYNNSLTAPLFTASTPSNYTFLNNSLSNPSFVSSTDFHLQSGSPAIGKGVSVAGLTTDYAGNIVNNPPSIGAYESGSTATPSAPIYQGSVVANATPSLLEITYNLSLANIAPAASSFSVLINAVTRSVTSVAISGTKVQLTLATGIKYGDIVTVSYAKPAANQLQTTNGGIAASFSPISIINNLINPAKDATPVTVAMTIMPNHVHNTVNVQLAYSSTPTTTISPEILRIFDTSGTLLVEKLLVAGVTSIKMPININSGVYFIKIIGYGLELASQKMRVY